MVAVGTLQDLALGFPEVTQVQRAGLVSFRVSGRSFLTVLADRERAVIYLDEAQVQQLVAEYPGAVGEVRRGVRLIGARVDFAALSVEYLGRLLAAAWRRQAGASSIVADEGGQNRRITVSLPLAYAVVLDDWLGDIDTAAALSAGVAPLTELTHKLALDYLARQLADHPGMSPDRRWREQLESARVRVSEERLRDLELWVSTLLDRTVDGDARDDAAMALGDFDDPEAVDALMQVAADPDDEWLHETVAESVAEILARRPRSGPDPATL